MLDGSTIRKFVDNERLFHQFVDDRFNRLDTNRDGLLSYSEMMKELQCLGGLQGMDSDMDNIHGTGTEDQEIFVGMVNLEEFRAETKRMMLAMASGLGALPVQVVLGENSFMKIALECESSMGFAL
ncbi:hypothetical protein H6P81_008057 [Aristolochia fimbriata]|uniref:EF-hand domain-containing protein n=1 Tax=Aristolochia fimbriata TaxID=158543 RepID=A0AAV7F270_ARIFI|nr:hypothetical protein H6P81_008057 [Aristolochia fimbriata]